MPAGRTRKKVLALAAFLPSLPDAVCRDSGHDPDLWHPDRPNESQEALAKSLCHTCPEEVECLIFSRIAHPIPGIWGGTTLNERKQLFSQHHVRSNSSYALR